MMEAYENISRPESSEGAAAGHDAKNSRRLTLRKGEKLRHRQLVEALFSDGNSTFAYPLRLNWRTLTEQELEASFRDALPRAIGSLQMLITVPKKKRRHAVDRVKMRRRIREAYRLCRLELKEEIERRPEIRTLSMAFIYIADKNEESRFVHKRMRQLLRRVIEALPEKKEKEEQK